MQAQWVKTNGLDSGFVRSFAFSGINSFAGTYKGVYLSTNNGLNWTQMNNGPGGNYVWPLTVNGANIFVGTDSGIYRSSNNGAIWAQVNNGLTSNFVYALNVIGTNIFAGTDSGVFLSGNNGTDWVHLNNGLKGVLVFSLATNGTNLFAGTNNGVYLSTNSGTNWSSFSNGLPGASNVWSIVISGQSIFAGTEGNGVFRSTNNGANWEQINNGLTNIYVYTPALSGNGLLVSTSGGVFLSTNNGTNWIQRNDGLGNNWVWSFGVTTSYVYAGTNGAGVWRRPLSELVTDVKEEMKLPKRFSLSQNYPNPFNPSTVIPYSLRADSKVKIIIYNALGQSIKVLEDGFKDAGSYSVSFNAGDLPSGIYFYRLEAGEFTQVKKMMLMK